MKLKHYNSATSFVPWKRTIPHPNNSFPTTLKKKKIVPYPQDACDLKRNPYF